MQNLIYSCQELDANGERVRDFLNYLTLLTTIIQGEYYHTRHLPIPGMMLGTAKIARIRKSLFLPDERFIAEALEEKVDYHQYETLTQIRKEFHLRTCLTYSVARFYQWDSFQL